LLLVYFSLAWLAGIFLGSILNIPWWALLMALLPLPLFFFWRGHKKQILMISLCLLAFCGGMLRYDAAMPQVTEASVQNYNESGALEIRGTVAAAPDIRDTYTQLTINVNAVNHGGKWQPAAGQVLVFASQYPAYVYGDVLQLKGTLTTPQKLEEFDYPGYLADRGIFSLMTFPQTERLDTGGGFKPLGWIYAFRELLAEELAAVLPEPQASLAQGILLGLRGNIPDDIKDNFTATGTTHILAISGVNLNIVAGLLVAAGVWLLVKHRRLYIWLTLAAVWGYALLTGFNPPVVRAAFIVSLFLSADLLGRQHSLLTALAFAAGVMTAFTPRVLWDASFQLSFVAMLGLLYTAPPLQRFGRALVEKVAGETGVIAATLRWVIDSAAVTLGVTILLWPLLAHYFGVFSLVSPLATVLILPALPAVMFGSALAAVFGLIFPPLGIALGWVAWLFLTYVLLIVNGGALLPAAALATGNLPLLPVAGYYLLLGGTFVGFRYRRQLAVFSGRVLNRLGKIPLKWAAPPLATLIVLCIIFNFTLPDDKLHVSYLDIGQGDAILIQNGNQDVLIDGGPSPRELNRELAAKMPFWDRTIELVIVTHPHGDHLAGLVDIIQKYHVRQVLAPATDSAAALWQEWLKLIAEKNIPSAMAIAGQRIALGGEAQLEIIAAPAPGSDETLDDEGLVLRLLDGTVSFLFTADITTATEMELLMARAPLPSTVLKVAHHGSATATSREFLAVVKPVLAVISVGADNDYGHPDKDTISRLASAVGDEHIYRTDRNGTIELITDGERLWLTADRIEK